jgi:hypothetical protein
LKVEGLSPDSVSVVGHPVADQLVKYENFELASIDRFKLSEISLADTPYHLINTALNIQDRNTPTAAVGMRISSSSAPNYRQQRHPIRSH